MYRQMILSHVRRIILDTTPHLRPEQVTEAASLTGDLDMDPSHLDSLISRLTHEVPETDIAFTPWYVQASRGQDSLGSLVDFLVENAWQGDSATVSAVDNAIHPARAAIHHLSRSAVLAHVGA